MASRTAGAVALLLLPILLAGCFAPTPDHVDDWRAEAKAHGAMGLAAEMDLLATEYAVLGRGEVAHLPGPFTLHPTATTSRSGPLAFFIGTVVGVGSGLIVLEGDEVAAVSGTLSGLPVTRAEVAEGEVHLALHDADVTDRPHVAFPPGQSELDSAWFFADHAPVQGRDLVVENATRAVLISDGNMTPLILPIHFDAAHIDLGKDARIEVASAEYDAPDFAYGGETSGGTVTPLGRAPLQAPAGVFGKNGSLRITPDGVTSRSTFRLTQALGPDGFALSADLELRPHQDRIPVDAGNISWVRVDFREKGYVGAAVLDNITVSGRAADLVRVPLDHPPWLVQELWDTVMETGWMAPFVALPVAIASPWFLLGEALLKGFDCVFNDCPADHPYPRWVAPGGIGRFYYQVDATNAAPGTYEGTITFLGENHDTVSIDVVIDVR